MSRHPPIHGEALAMGMLPDHVGAADLQVGLSDAPLLAMACTLPDRPPGMVRLYLCGSDWSGQ